jgi:Fe(3+) dicitrate transport protein
LFKLGKRLSITPGVRAESIINVNNGNINTSLVNNTGEFNNQSKRKFLLLGVGAQYEISKTINMYANYTQNYRPVLFSDLTPSSTTEVIDKNLKDASGYNVDAGIRGTVKQFLNFDIGAFYLHYDNRIGTITDNGLPFKTNIGTSVSKGVESYVELDLFGIIEGTKKLGRLNAYASVAFIDAQYTQWNNPLIVNDPLKTRVGKKVENAPESIQRYGVTYIYKTFSITYQINSVSAVFSDADNTEKANSTATNGLIPAYTIMDASLSYSFAKKYNVKAGVNNLANVSYFTRRSGGYPGPGLMPGNGRTLFLGLGCKF